MLTKSRYDIAFIIPAYNIGEYLSECIESVLKQISVSYQIIIVNDGSQDDTLNIANSYADKYSFISVIDKKNEGVSIARNVGLHNCDAEYVCFMDGDDIYIKEFAKYFLDLCRANNLDIIRGRYSFYKDGIIMNDVYPKSIVCENTPILGKDFLDLFLKKQCSEVVPWLGFFKRDFLVSNHIEFPDGIAFTEDQLFFLRTLCVDDCISMDIDYIFYGYRLRGCSATNCGYSAKKVKDIFEMVKAETDLVNTYPHLKKSIYCFASTTLAQVFSFYKLGNKTQKKSIITDLRKMPFKKLIRFAYSNNIRIKLILASYVPGVLRLIYR
jgi:glycosyltransferase involved in cell wall biosynthesis